MLCLRRGRCARKRTILRPECLMYCIGGVLERCHPRPSSTLNALFGRNPADTALQSICLVWVGTQGPESHDSCCDVPQDKSSGNSNLKIEALSFLRLLLVSNPPE
eukprot:179745-Chlamydomonas_euryale.AAC.1